jgi:type IV secretion system protein TrbE
MYRLDRFNRNKEYLRYSMPFGKILSVKHAGRQIALVMNKDGSFQVSWKYRGPDLDSAVREQLAVMTGQLNNMFASLPTGWILYFEAQRTPSTHYASDVYFPDPITKAIDDERKNFFSDGQHFESDYYLTAYWQPPNDSQERMKEFVIEGRQKKTITATDMMDVFFEQVDKIYGMYNILQIPSEFLSPDEMITYLHSTVSDNCRLLKLPKKQLLLDQYLYDTPLYGGLEPRLGNQHVRVVAPIKYRGNTIFGLFNDLNRLNFPYRWVTRYCCLGKQDSISALEGVKRGWNGKIKSMQSMIKELILGQPSDGNINENAKRKFDEVKDAITAIEGDVTSYGYYSTAIIVMDEDIEQVEDKAKSVRQVFVNLGFSAKIEDLNSLDTWMGCIPGNVGHNIRRPLISCGNLVHMMPISDIWAGPPRNKHLHAPVLLYTQTDGKTPFRLSLHVGDVGHTLIVGPTGAGKSVQLNLIAAQFRKYKNAKVFIFDKGASSRVLAEGVGGHFYDLGKEENQLSFQPLSQIADEKERQWASEWLCDYARAENLEITPERKKLIWESLSSVAAAPDRLKTMTSFVNYLQDNKLKTTFEPLTVNHAYGSIFDAKSDNLTFSSWQSFEMEKLMTTKRIVGPVLMYIFHRIEQRLKGDPTIIILDECWVFFDNPLFAEKIREWLKVLRKSNASVIFATQSLADITESPIFSTILESCQSRIFLPNDKALEENMKKKYISFGLNQRQIEIIASAIQKRQYYYTSPLGCRLYDLGLEHCPLTLAYTATNKADLNRCQEIIDEFGHENFNEHWMNYRNVKFPKIIGEEDLSL